MTAPDPNHYQRMAADPVRTVLVSANAGSGKTKVLVDRVSRLLLRKSGPVDPDKILCLTYTKAAATEMQSRLFEKLGQWSVMSPDRLNASLDDLMGQTKDRSKADLSEARELFAKALETPGGLKVQTIHAFCEQILGRFPIEAGIIPGFDPMDAAEQQAIHDQVKTDLLVQARAAPESELAQAVRTLSAEMANITFDGLLGWMATKTEAFDAWALDGGTTVLAETLGLSVGDTVERIIARFWDATDFDKLRHVAEALSASPNKTDRNSAATIQAILADNAAGLTKDNFETYAGLFLTTKGQPRVSPTTTKASEAAKVFIGAKDYPQSAEMSRVIAASQDCLAVFCLKMTQAVYIVGQAYSRLYVDAKRAARKLDFNDQIAFVKRLLKNRGVAEWVRYKLDGGIEHILIDEAQDTSPSQWNIIDSLQDGFPPADPQKPNERLEKTFFAVGDEKQSIYSFQGAEPEVFRERTRSDDRRGSINTIPMTTSFRTSPDVLNFIDEVFVHQKIGLKMFRSESEDESAYLEGHNAFWDDTGRVDLWPLSPRPDIADDDVPWEFPVDAPERATAREKLAQTLARQIREWLNKGEPVYDRRLKNADGEKGVIRPMQAKDILILVRRRNDFFDAVIRHLKREGVAVAGADRLVLRDSIAVKDLLALTRFVLLPSDDLSLAEIMRSPILDISEQDLFNIAHNRGDQTLWSALRNHPKDLYQTAAKFLQSIQTLAQRHAPYEFYARVLDLTGPNGVSVRKQMFGRLGQEAEDAINAFLAQALEHQRKGAPSLHHFLRDFSNNDQDIKREMEAGHNEVRVMTVHGAKGLEAPVVILPDTTQAPDSRNSSSLYPFDDGYVYLPSKSQTPDMLEAYREAVKAADQREYLRLLYVAMTRAESRLVICGYENGNAGERGYRDDCWYDILKTVMERCDSRDLITPFGAGHMMGGDVGAIDTQTAPDVLEKTKLPDWLFEPAAPEYRTKRQLTPSQLLSENSDMDVPVRSPISDTPDRFLRGNIIHKLLEILPDRPIDTRREMALLYLDGYQEIAPEQATAILDEVFAVLDNPDFAHIFAPGSKAEINLAGGAKGLPDDIVLNAQIDRLAVTDSTVYIIDYKSNRPPPATQDGVADIYWGQMAAYREMIREIYPDRDIRCALLWTDGPRLMWLDHDRLNSALTQIAALPT